MKVFIGTNNPTKVNAVKSVFLEFFKESDIDFFRLSVNSNVSSQPINLEEVITGAINRAENALSIGSESYNKDIKPNEMIYGVGIEAGLVKIPKSITGYLDFQYCAIIDRFGKRSLGTGPGWEYPPEITNSVINNPGLEIGTIMGRISGDKDIKFHDGAIGFYSKGHIRRPEITKDPVRMALIPFLNYEKYFGKKNNE